MSKYSIYHPSDSNYTNRLIELILFFYLCFYSKIFIAKNCSDSPERHPNNCHLFCCSPLLVMISRHLNLAPSVKFKDLPASSHNFFVPFFFLYPHCLFSLSQLELILITTKSTWTGYKWGLKICFISDSLL